MAPAGYPGMNVVLHTAVHAVSEISTSNYSFVTHLVVYLRLLGERADWTEFIINAPPDLRERLQELAMSVQNQRKIPL